MNIVKEDINALNAVLKLNIQETDYRDKVDNILKDYRKKVNMPGFRKGMVPMSVVHKMYGVSVKADEINKIIQDNLYKYLQEEKIEYLGNPIPKEEEKEKIKFETQKDFTFSYELGLSPKFSVNLSDKLKLNKYVIRIDDTLIQKNISDLKKRYGNVASAETIEENDMLVGVLRELKSDLPIEKQTSIYLENVEDRTERSKFIGKKIGDKIITDPKKLAKDENDVSAMLGIKVEDLKKISKEFELEIKSIHRVDPAEENQDFYDRIFGAGKINGKDEFIRKTTEELKEVMLDFSNKKLKKDLFELLIDKLKLDLPDDFLKRWLKLSNQELDDQKITEDYDKFSKDMRWMLIENKIVKENDLSLPYEEIASHVKDLLKKQYEYYGMPSPEDAMLDQYVQNILSNEKESRKIASDLMDKKIKHLIEQKISIKEKEVSYDEFLKVLNEKPKVNLFSKLFNF